MPHYKYERLGAQDAAFLIFESTTVHTHVAATLIIRRR